MPERDAVGKPRECPHGRAADKRAVVRKQAFGLRQQPAFAGIADGDQAVSDEAVAADPLDRRAGKEGAEAGIVEPAEVVQRRRLEIGAGGEFHLPARFGELVPRADGQAVVASVDSVSHLRPERPIDRPLVLDREVGDAAPCIQPVGRRESLGRADVEAGAAMVALRLIVRQFQIGEQRAEEQP